MQDGAAGGGCAPHAHRCRCAGMGQAVARGKRREGPVGGGEGALSACVPAAVPTPETAGRWRAPVNAAVGAKGAVGGGRRGRRPSAPSRRVATATVQDAAAAGGLACGRHGGHTGCA